MAVKLFLEEVCTVLAHFIGSVVTSKRFLNKQFNCQNLYESIEDELWSLIHVNTGFISRRIADDLAVITVAPVSEKQKFFNVTEKSGNFVNVCENLFYFQRQ